jgi:hypothetical protein
MAKTKKADVTKKIDNKDGLTKREATKPKKSRADIHPNQKVQYSSDY